MKIIYITILLTLFASQTEAQNRITTPFAATEIALKLYPNPASTQITFNFEYGYDRNYSFQIFNFIGKKIVELRSVAPKTVVDLSYFYRGVYIFQVRDKSGKIVDSGRFTVER